MPLYDDLVGKSNRAEIALMRLRAFLIGGLETVNDELVWVEQPDQGPPYLGAYGAAGAALTLLACDVERDEDLIHRLLVYLGKQQLPSGGWTIRNASPVALTTACSFAVSAYGEAGLKTHEEQRIARKGADWLLAHRRSSGWPLFEGGAEVSLVATALATRALRSVEDLLPAGGREAIKAACDHLASAASANGGWSGRGDPKLTSIPVSAVILSTLTHCGHKAFSPAVSGNLAWLRQQADLSHDGSDSFYVHLPNGHSAAVNYVHFTSALVLEALIGADKENVADHAVLRAAESVLSSQAEEGYWRSPLAPRQTPTWLLMDGARSLKKFVRAVATSAGTLRFTEELATVRAIVDEMSTGRATVDTTLQVRLDTIERTLAPIAHAMNTIGVVWTWFRRVVPFLALFAIGLGYLVMRSYFKLGQTSDWIGIAITILVAWIAVWDARRKH